MECHLSKYETSQSPPDSDESVLASMNDLRFLLALMTEIVHTAKNFEVDYLIYFNEAQPLVDTVC